MSYLVKLGAVLALSGVIQAAQQQLFATPCPFEGTCTCEHGSPVEVIGVGMFCLWPAETGQSEICECTGVVNNHLEPENVCLPPTYCQSSFEENEILPCSEDEQCPS